MRSPLRQRTPSATPRPHASLDPSRATRHRGAARSGLLLVLGLVVALLVGRSSPVRRGFEALWSWAEGGGSSAEGSFWCPMDPQIVRPREGICPICSMDLVPFEAGQGATAPPGVLQLSDRQIQQAGVRLGTAIARTLAREVETTGRLEVDPRRRSIVTVDYPGPSTVEELFVFSAGEPIRQGQVVAHVRNDRAEALLKEYRGLLKRTSALRRDQGDPAELKEALANVDRLRKLFDGFGLPDPHINVLAAKPKHILSEPLFPVIAFEGGVALAPPGRQERQAIGQGGELLSMANLDELWLYLDLYEQDLPFVDVGTRVLFETRGVPGETFRTTVRFVEAMMDAKSQIVRARCRATNVKGLLRPGMIVEARLSKSLPDVLSVPESAVLQSGRRNVVIVSEGAGRFRPRLVELGRRHLSQPRAGEEAGFAPTDERFHEIRAGLEGGERVVVAGNFLLNAEAQFQGILKKLVEAEEAQQSAPSLSAEAAQLVDGVWSDYFAIAEALTLDDPQPLQGLARQLAQRARERALRDLTPAFARLAGAADELARQADPSSGGEVDLEQSRRHFGSLSRELVAFASTFQPARMSDGTLHLFRCPMAEDYGFDLWLQRGETLANPYMGQRMLECGMPVAAGDSY